MTTLMTTGPRANPWRVAAWSVVAVLLLAPAVAMRFTTEIAWGAEDFVFAAVLLIGCGAAFELLARRSASLAYRGGVGVALVATFLIVWINAAVGMIGSEGDPANLMFAGVILVGAVGAIVTRFRPGGMARAMLATALAQTLVGALAGAGALIGKLGSAGPIRPLDILGLTGVFVTLWLLSAWLFSRAMRDARSAAVGEERA